MKGSGLFAARLPRIVLAAVGAGLVMSAVIAVPAYAAKGGGSGGGTTPTPVMALNYEANPTGGGTLFGNGSDFKPKAFTQWRIYDPGQTAYTPGSTLTSDTGTFSFKHPANRTGKYTVDVYQYSRGKLTKVASATLTVP